ncbi:hypothetical protein NKJ16_31505 [Mesorhizobium sp. M0179]|uniref:hypothetical protein n=1 Tax=unclassified Mesorhizobium TaxID=325217 RepID=UPI0003CE879E|nr:MULTISPECIES: hypothetical protein [unclassified Mesorhizobium]ESX11997.1 hypothetical protein X768_10630 [Mesorhizobium sp. LSJC265A00]ESY05252.1 hypothetical protein X753_17630 [Mesorhizobium sp. LNJC399B00]WJI70493.1 hypothetical protein NLY36_06745 [Mesorhizobium sp. C399B]
MLDPHGSLFIGGDHKRVDVGTSKADDLVASPIQLVVDINRKPAGHSPGPLSQFEGAFDFAVDLVGRDARLLGRCRQLAAKSLAAIGSPRVTIAARRGFISSPSS